MPRFFLILLIAFTTGSEGLMIHAPAAQRAPEIFAAVAEGLSAADISRFSSRFSTQVHLTLRGGESGLFSANQAYTLLQAYVKERSTSQCSLSGGGENDATTYATGGILLTLRGRREKAQVYVALARSHDRWVITHLTIY
jgi:hypothetical protein